MKTRSSDKKHPHDQEKEEKLPPSKLRKTRTEAKKEKGGKMGKRLAQENPTAEKEIKEETKEKKSPEEAEEVETKEEKAPASPPKHKRGRKSTVAEKKPVHESNMLEKGHIYFFYRPKVEHHEAHNAGDVQRLYMVLKPQVEAGKAPLGKNRLIILANKKLPIPKKHNRFWGFVEHTAKSIDEITHKLDPESYSTETRGERHLEGCRPCGMGVYNIVHHLDSVYRSKQHTHLAYVLEVPEKLGPVQHAFNIENEGSFILIVKNPTTSTSRGLSSSKRAEYPHDLQEKFQGRKFIPVEPTSLLDYDGAELILIGAREDVAAELGEPGKELEESASEEELEAEHGKDDHRCTLAEEQVFHGLHMHHKEHPAEPLIEGKWE